MNKIFIFVLSILATVRVISSLHNPIEGKNVRISGVLTAEPKAYESKLLIEVANVSAFVPFNPDITYGSYVELEGTYKGGTLENVNVRAIHRGDSLLSTARQKILKTVKEAIPEPEASLLAGITIGDPNVDPRLRKALYVTGTSHIVVASGGNLAIIAMFLEKIFAKYLKRRIFLPITAILLTLYSLITGMGAPIVRALIMWLVLLLAQMTGRVSDTWRVFIYTILLMLILKPSWIFDVSFYLSVGSTAGVLFLSRPIEKKLSLITFDNLRNAISTTVSAQIAIFPISVFVFKNINLLVTFWNILVLWTVPYITILGLLGSLFSLVWEPLGKIILWSSYPLTWYFVSIVSI